MCEMRKFRNRRCVKMKEGKNEMIRIKQEWSKEERETKEDDDEELEI